MEIAISTFKATCLEVLRKVKRTGQPVTITRHGEPIAQIMPPPQRATGWLGSARGTAKILVSDDELINTTFEDEWDVLKN